MKFNRIRSRSGSVLLLMVVLVLSVKAQDLADKIHFVDYYFESGSPMNWEVVGDSAVKISLLYDYERNSPNRAAGHWYFRVAADKGTHIKLILSNMDNVWNGGKTDHIGNLKQKISCFISYDQKNWEGITTERLPEKELLVELDMKEPVIYVARIPPYTVSDLNNLMTLIENNPLVKITKIGETVEERPLEMIRLGKKTAPYSIVIRVRAHPWESGGNWLLEGLVQRFLQNDDQSKGWVDKYCLYMMPMANKDGVARGMTRFNLKGMDLNRDWKKMADPDLCPEKYAFEKFVEKLIAEGKKPVLAFDIHNDDWGGLGTAPHEKSDSLFLRKTKLFEALMKKYTWFSEGTSYSWGVDWEAKKNFMMDDGFAYRYSIDAYVYELNVNWIPRLNKIPSIGDWKKLGADLNQVFYEYLDELDNL